MMQTNPQIPTQTSNNRAIILLIIVMICNSTFTNGHIYNLIRSTHTTQLLTQALLTNQYGYSNQEIEENSVNNAEEGPHPNPTEDEEDYITQTPFSPTRIKTYEI